MLNPSELLLLKYVKLVRIYNSVVEVRNELTALRCANSQRGLRSANWGQGFWDEGNGVGLCSLSRMANCLRRPPEYYVDTPPPFPGSLVGPDQGAPG